MTTIESRPDTLAPDPRAGIPIDTDADDDTPTWIDGFIDVFTSTDHKVIGRHYFFSGLAGLLAIVVVNVLIGIERLDGTDRVLDIDVIPQLLDAQRVGLVFAVLLPLAMAMCVALVPLQVGARSIVFPRLAFAGFWMWLGGAIVTVVALGLGAALARLELKILFEEVLRRYPDMSLIEQPEKVRSLFLNQPRELRVRLNG